MILNDNDDNNFYIYNIYKQILLHNSLLPGLGDGTGTRCKELSFFGTVQVLVHWALGIVSCQLCLAQVERLKKYDSMCPEELLEIVKGGNLFPHISTS